MQPSGFNENINQQGVTKNTLKVSRKLGQSPHDSVICSLDKTHCNVFHIKNILLVQEKTLSLFISYPFWVRECNAFSVTAHSMKLWCVWVCLSWPGQFLCFLCKLRAPFHQEDMSVFVVSSCCVQREAVSIICEVTEKSRVYLGFFWVLQTLAALCCSVHGADLILVVFRMSWRNENWLMWLISVWQCSEYEDVENFLSDFTTWMVGVNCR